MATILGGYALYKLRRAEKNHRDLHEWSIESQVKVESLGADVDSLKSQRDKLEHDNRLLAERVAYLEGRRYEKVAQQSGGPAQSGEAGPPYEERR